jgi:glycosyltransferase involved in cell wall biosynthesis
LLVGLAGWWIARLKRAPLIFEVRDLWPESLAAVGVGNTDSSLHRVLGAIAGFLYRSASRIVVVSPAFSHRLQRHWQVPRQKISVVQNGVETALFKPQYGREIRERLNAEGKFVVSYIGTLGMAHGLGTIIEAAAMMRETAPDVLFLMVGDGADRERLLALSAERYLTNIRILPAQSRGEVPSYIGASDACLVLLKKSDVFETVIPTKMLEFMSCAKPVILGVDGQARQIVESARAGLCVEPESAQGLCAAIRQLQQQPATAEVMGRNGREFILQNYSRAHTAMQYLELLQNLIGKGRLVMRTAA